MLRLLRRNIIWMALLIVLGVWSLDTAQAAESPAGVVEGVRVGEVSVGADHACAIRTTGELVCWGDNSQAEGTPPAGLFVQVSAGSDFTCAIRDDGTLACWGTNGAGQLDAPTGLYREVSAGADHACAIRDDGVALCWGADTGTIPSDLFVRLAAGDGFTCGLIDGFTLTCWGAIATPPSGHYSQLSAGTDHACAIRDDGLPQCWGSDAGGKATPAAGVFVQLSAGVDRTCGVRDDGVAVCWGSPSSPPSDLLVSLDTNTGTCGIKGDGTLTCWDAANLQTPPSGTFTRRLLSAANQCLMKENGGVECASYNDWHPTSVISPGIHLSAHWYGMGCVIKLDRGASCWGHTYLLTPTLRLRSLNNKDSIRLCGTTTQGSVQCPINYAPFPAESMLDSFATNSFVCGLSSDGSVKCIPWPYSSTPPPQVPADRRYIQLTGEKNVNAVCGIKADGTVECWGSGSVPTLPAGRYLQISYGPAPCGLRSDRTITCTNSTAPNQLYTQVTTVGRNACGIRVDTLIECWGADTEDNAMSPFLQLYKPYVLGIPIGAPVQDYGRPYALIQVMDTRHVHYKILEGALPDGIEVITTTPIVDRYFALTGTTTLTTQQVLPVFTLQVTDRLNFVDTRPYSVYVAHQPVADAGLDQQVARSSTVQLNGNGSSDPLNTPELPVKWYRWQQIDGPTVDLSNSEQGSTPTFIAPATDAVLTFKLDVGSAYWTISYPDTVVITVGDGPVTNLQAGVRLPAVTAESVPFTATAQGNSITYAWSFGDGGTATGASPSHIYTAPGTYTAIVSATNGTGTLSRTLTVPVRSRPIAAAGADQQVTIAATVLLDGSASSDPAQEALQFRWQQISGPPVALTNPTSSQPSFVAPTQPTILDFTLVVTNTSGLADLSPDVVRITVDDVAMTGLEFTSSAPHEVGTTTQFTATIASGSNVTYAWNFGDGASGSGLNPTHSYAQAGSYTVTLTATNSRGSQTISHPVVIQAQRWMIYTPFVIKPDPACSPVCGLRQLAIRLTQR